MCNDTCNESRNHDTPESWTERQSAVSTAVPSELQSQLNSGENSDDEDEADCNEACAAASFRLVVRHARQQFFGSVEDLSFDASACRVVQKALEVLMLICELMQRISLSSKQIY